MDFNMEKIGVIEKTATTFEVTLNDITTSYNTIPPIMQDIAPAQSQFPDVNDILDYYQMEKMDVWEYFHKSNGLKQSRNVWFMSEPKGEVWLPIMISEKYRAFNSLIKEGAECKVLMTGQLYTMYRSLNVLPPAIKEPLVRNGDTRFSTTTGVMYYVTEYPGIKGTVAKLILNFPE